MYDLRDLSIPILSTFIIVSMASFFLCCLRKKSSADVSDGKKLSIKREDSKQRNKSSDKTKAENGLPAEKKSIPNSADTKDDLGDFSAVQRETEILRSYRKPPPPKHRARQSRAPRAMKGSTENLDIFTELSEENSRLSSDEREDDNKDDVDGATMRPHTEDSSKRDVRSSMLADIEQTLLALHMSEQKSEEDLTLASRGEQGDTARDSTLSVGAANRLNENSGKTPSPKSSPIAKPKRVPKVSPKPSPKVRKTVGQAGGPAMVVEGETENSSDSHTTSLKLSSLTVQLADPTKAETSPQSQSMQSTVTIPQTAEPSSTSQFSAEDLATDGTKSNTQPSMDDSSKPTTQPSMDDSSKPTTQPSMDDASKPPTQPSMDDSSKPPADEGLSQGLETASTVYPNTSEGEATHPDFSNTTNCSQLDSLKDESPDLSNPNTDTNTEPSGKDEETRETVLVDISAQGLTSSTGPELVVPGLTNGTSHNGTSQTSEISSQDNPLSEPLAGGSVQDKTFSSNGELSAPSSANIEAQDSDLSQEGIQTDSQSQEGTQRRESVEEQAGKGKLSKIPVRAGSKPRSSPPKCAVTEKTTVQ